jgi:hypothetical protein
VNHLKAIAAAPILLISLSVYANSFTEEIARVRQNKAISCPANRLQPALGQHGAMWSCRSEDDNVKLYITEEASRPGTVKRAMFKTERALSSSFSPPQRNFVDAVIKHFGASHAKEISTAFFECTDKTIAAKSYAFELSCYQGASVRSNTVIVYPK